MTADISDPLDYRPPSDSAFGSIIAGLAVLGVFLGGFLLWSMAADLDSASLASGTIKIAGNSKTVQHLEGGIVREVLVRDGDRVEQGQLLVVLDDVQTRATAEVVGSQYDALLAREARLFAERSGAESITFPPELTSRRRDPGVAALLADQTNLFLTRRKTINSEILLIDSRISQLKDRIRGLSAQRDALQQQRQLIGSEMADTNELYKSGFATRTRVLAMERSLAAISGQQGELMGTISQVQEGISEAELQKRQRLAIRENEINSEIDTVRANRADAFDRLSIVRDTLERSRITAPKSGVVMNLRAFTIGGVLDRGARIMDIVPDDAPRLIEAGLRPEDIDNVTVGMRAQVHLTAYKQRAIPIIHGTVLRVSADRIVTPERPDPHYQIIVEVDPEELAKLPEITLTPGMPAEVMIPNGSRTALDYLIGPLFQAMHRAGREQ